MTDQEINKSVAMKLGEAWRVGYPKEHLPDYCHSIEAAWEIVEKSKLHLIPTDKGWFCGSGEIIKEGSGHEIWHPGYCVTRNECQCGYCAITDTAPMAICLAFLKMT